MNKGILTGYGLIGNPLSHSWSAQFFREKFDRENITDRWYRLFPLEDISDFPGLLRQHTELKGLNVTIPFKEKIIPYLDELDEKAAEIGAVNTVKISRQAGKIFTTGYNTDEEGFRLSSDFSAIKFACILGTGGASRAVAHALEKTGIPYTFVSRNPDGKNRISYPEFQTFRWPGPVLIINTTPLGMYPDVHSCPAVPFNRLSAQDFLYDLVYNPAQTLFLENGGKVGARIQNGLKMLTIQAESAYEIWNREDH